MLTLILSPVVYYTEITIQLFHQRFTGHLPCARHYGVQHTQQIAVFKMMLLDEKVTTEAKEFKMFSHVHMYQH